MILVVLAFAAWMPSAYAQSRVGGIAAESGVPGQTAVTTQVSGLQAGSPVPTLTLTVAPLAGGLVPTFTPAIQAGIAVTPSVAEPQRPAPIAAQAQAPVAAALLKTASFQGAVATPSGGLGLTPSEGGDHRTRRAVAAIRDTSRDWTGEAPEDDDDPTHAAHWVSTQRRRAGALERASAEARLGPVEGAIARTLWSVKATQLRARADREEKTGPGVSALLARYGVAFKGERRAALEELKRYVPGFKPELVVGGEALADFTGSGATPGGYSVIPLRDRVGEEARGGFIWLGTLREADFIEVAAHEGFHQGDLGYRDGARALTAAHGKEAGLALATALLEGFTELRTREAMDRLGRDAIGAKDGLPARYGQALRTQWGGTLEEALERRNKGRDEHGYDPYVKLAEAIIAKPGGRAALEAFVAKGDLSPLETVLGRPTMKVLADISAAADGSEGAGPLEFRLANSLGVAAWARSHLASAARGEAVPDADSLRVTVQASVAAAAGELDNAWRPESAWRRRAILSLDLTPALTAGVGYGELIARIRDAGRLPAWKHWIPPMPDSTRYALESEMLVLGAAAYPTAGAAWLVYKFLGAPAYGLSFGSLLAFDLTALAALGVFWLVGEVLSGLMLGRRPSRSLPWRW